MMAEKLQKVLANAGLGSRREIEKWISAGRLSINGKRAKLGDRASAQDSIVLDGKAVRLHNNHQQKIQALIYHKPEGVICSRNDPSGRPTVFDTLPKIAQGRWISIGRLDLNTSGLLLFTNNGDLANRMMHPSTEIEREYLARVRGEVSKETIEILTKVGVDIDGKLSHFNSVKPQQSEQSGSNHWYRVVIKEGKYREVRRMWELVGHPVSRLKRIRYGTVKLTRDVKQGKVTKMAPKQLEKMVLSAGLSEQFSAQLYSASRPIAKGKNKGTYAKPKKKTQLTRKKRTQ